MAEAFARMHLRDSVLQSDIDRAISVMVTSFVSTQKIGAQRALEKYLKKYMTFGEDAYELLNHVLCDMMNDEYKYFYYKKTAVPGGVLSVDMDQFEIKVKYFF
jgi:DNA replication licensing factor MCM2